MGEAMLLVSVALWIEPMRYGGEGACCHQGVEPDSGRLLWLLPNCGKWACCCQRVKPGLLPITVLHSSKRACCCDRIQLGAGCLLWWRSSSCLLAAMLYCSKGACRRDRIQLGARCLLWWRGRSCLLAAMLYCSKGTSRHQRIQLSAGGLLRCLPGSIRPRCRPPASTALLPRAVPAF